MRGFGGGALGYSNKNNFDKFVKDFGKAGSDWIWFLGKKGKSIIISLQSRDTSSTTVETMTVPAKGLDADDKNKLGAVLKLFDQYPISKGHDDNDPNLNIWKNELIQRSR